MARTTSLATRHAGPGALARGPRGTAAPTAATRAAPQQQSRRVGRLGSGVKKSVNDVSTTKRVVVARNDASASASAVDVFRSERGKGKRREYLVKWADRGEEGNTWVTAMQLKGAMSPGVVDALLADFICDS
jgi:hypothetical protein